MISICIPVYNFDVRKLVKDLHQQAVALDLPFEIMLLDDASEDNFIFLNREIAGLDHVRWMELPTNIGRSKIRNQLAGMAHFPYLIFMDCDSKVLGNDFLKNYLDEICEDTLIICGGRSHEEMPDDTSLLLRWMYGKKREEKPASERKKAPNHAFMTNNFLIKKDLFQKIKFDEGLKGYGHEDSLFGYALLKRGITVFHIDNPLAHIGLEPAPIFLAKTEQAVQNLWYIHHNLPQYKEMTEGIRLLKAFSFLEKWKLQKWVAAWFRWRKNSLLKNLLSAKPNLKKFDWYKLGYLCTYSLTWKKPTND